MVMVGHGMTGSLRTYSTAVLCGNWNEDRIGRELAGKLQSADCSKWASTTQDLFKTLQQPQQSSTGYTARGTRVQIKERMRGVPSKLLFAHVVNPDDGDKLDQERFKTTSATSFAGGDFAGLDKGQRARQREAAVAREKRASEAYATTTSLMARRR